MSEIQLIILTSFITALLGLIGYIIISFVFEPIKELKKGIGLVSNNLEFWAAALNNPGIHKDKLAASSDFRRSSTMIRAIYYVIPGRGRWGQIYRIPNVKNIKIACKKLMFLSNVVSIPPNNLDSISINHIQEEITKLKKALNIETDFNN